MGKSILDRGRDLYWVEICIGRICIGAGDLYWGKESVLGEDDLYSREDLYWGKDLYWVGDLY